MTDTSGEVVEKAEVGKESTPESAADTLRRIAENNATDVGTLARLLLAGIEGDDVAADEPIPAAYPGERKMDEAGNLWEYTDDRGWVLLSELETPDEPANTPWRPPWQRQQENNPAAPGTTVDERSQEGREV